MTTITIHFLSSWQGAMTQPETSSKVGFREMDIYNWSLIVIEWIICVIGD